MKNVRKDKLTRKYEQMYAVQAKPIDSAAITKLFQRSFNVANSIGQIAVNPRINTKLKGGLILNAIKNS